MIFGGNIMAKLKTGRHTSALKEARKAEKRTDWQTKWWNGGGRIWKNV